MINHNQFQKYIASTYGSPSALLIKDNDPSSPTGIRTWGPNDTANFNKWLQKQAPTQIPVRRKDPGPLPTSEELFCLNIKQAAERTGVGAKTIRSWTTKKKNPLPHIRDGRRVIIPLSTMMTWLQDEALTNDYGRPETTRVQRVHKKMR